MSLAFASLRALGDALRGRHVSPVELAESSLARLDTIGRRLNAVVSLTRERALAQARRAEGEIAAGQWRGPLHGVPWGAKDLLATAGTVPTTWGAAPFRSRCLDEDATVVRRLDAAGAVLVAKLAMVELAGGMGYRQPNASFTGPGRSPWAEDAWSGGSSSGSGAAVAAGCVPFSIGSETWGSILAPAAFCGATGLRPTYGRVSRHGAMTLCWTLDKLGPLARSADDCGLVLEAIAGADPLDPTAASLGWRHEADAGRRRFRFAVVRDVDAAVDAPVRDNFRRALAVLEQVGDIEEIVLPDLPYEAIARIILWVEASSAFAGMIERGEIASLTAPEDRVTPYARDAILAKDYLRACRLRGVIARDVDRVLAHHDALLAPSRGTVAPRLDEEFRSPIRGARDVMGAIGNLAGLPAVGVPNGFDARGVPTGLQFVGRAWDESVVLAAAQAYQALTDWHRRPPPLAA